MIDQVIGEPFRNQAQRAKEVLYMGGLSGHGKAWFRLFEDLKDTLDMDEVLYYGYERRHRELRHDKPRCLKKCPLHWEI